MAADPHTTLPATWAASPLTGVPPSVNSLALIVGGALDPSGHFLPRGGPNLRDGSVFKGLLTCMAFPFADADQSVFLFKATGMA